MVEKLPNVQVSQRQVDIRNIGNTAQQSSAQTIHLDRPALAQDKEIGTDKGRSEIMTAVTSTSVNELFVQTCCSLHTSAVFCSECDTVPTLQI